MKYDLIAEAYVRMYSPIETYLSEDVLMEDRIEFLKNNIGVLDTSHDDTAIHQDKNSIIDHFANNADPSRNKIHTQYILNLYKKRAIKQSDAPRIRDALTNFDRYKPLLNPDDRNLNHKTYPTIQHIEDKVAPHIGSSVTRKEKIEAAKKNPLDSEAHKLIYDNTNRGGNMRIFKLADNDDGVEAAKVFYGRKGLVHPTVCCHTWGTPKTVDLGYTDDRENRMIDYTQGKNPFTNIFMIHSVNPKTDKVDTVYSYHLGSKQMMDPDNKNVSPDEFNKTFPNDQFSDAINKNHELLKTGIHINDL
jgi:hypothetical protein